jgi:hypothetical protein
MKILEEDIWLTRPEAENALGRYLQRPVSLKRAERRKGLQHKLIEGLLFFRQGELVRWANAKKRTPTCSVDLRGTALGNWMHANAKTMWGFARELGIKERWLALLVGRERSNFDRKQLRLPSRAILALLAERTGIDERVLVADALNVMPKAAE